MLVLIAAHLFSAAIVIGAVLAAHRPEKSDRSRSLPPLIMQRWPFEWDGPLSDA